MPRALCYADAVKLLGGDGPLVKAIDRLTGGLLLLATGGGSELALNLFDAKGELAAVSGRLVGRLRDKVHGLSRIDRTERLTAAHKVIVLTSYFEALSTLDLPFGREALPRGRTTQVVLATGESAVSDRLGDLATILSDTSVPGECLPFGGDGPPDELRRFYSSVSARIVTYVQGLDAWNTVSESRQASFTDSLATEVPAGALRGYEEHLRRLAAEFPEVAFWTHRRGLGSVHEQLRQLHTGLEGLGQVLSEIASGAAPDDRREALARRYRNTLERPIVATGEVPAGLAIPSLAAAYINHRYRAAPAAVSARLDQESWWQEFPVQEDVQEFLAGYLTSARATEGPLVVLGQPGSGKSVLTMALAARLPARDFLTIRVPLREVPVDTDLQSQIEYAIRDATGENLSWPVLARSAGDALPVVLLDGFDELLQATGTGQTDYLEQITRFQEREADQGRPVAVIVTSRTAVADRARIPQSGAVALRLETFSESQVERWLTVWNNHNSAYLTEHGLSALPASVVLRQPDLAAQPLLLMMLALYDLAGNALQRHGEGLAEADLYERILTSFAEREVRKTRPELHAGPLQTAVEEELLLLSVAAFTMFNRGRQWAAEDELSGDLVAMLGDSVVPRGATGFHAAATPAQTLVGRFFFIHEAQALRNDVRLTSCEFLHATFGEYLVARLTVRELDDLALVASARRRHTGDDGFLRALLSFSPLTIRGKIVDFLTSLMQRLSADRRALAREVLLTAFRGALAPWKDVGHEGYGPEQVSMPARHAAYSANLVVLILMAGHPDPVTGRDLFPQTPSVKYDWRRHAMLWRSQFTIEGWTSLAPRLRLERTWTRGERDISLSLAHWTPPDPDGFWVSNIAPENEDGWAGWSHVAVEGLRRESYFTCDLAEDIAWHALLPIIQALDVTASAPREGTDATTAFGVLPDGRAVSAAQAILTLWMTSSGPTTTEELQQCYETCLRIIDCSRPQNDLNQHVLLARVLRQLAADRDRLSREFRDKLLQDVFRPSLLTATYLDEHPTVRQWAAQAFADIGFTDPARPGT
jgi:hypothetical protein